MKGFFISVQSLYCQSVHIDVPTYTYDYYCCSPIVAKLNGHFPSICSNFPNKGKSDLHI